MDAKAWLARWRAGEPTCFHCGVPAEPCGSGYHSSCRACVEAARARIAAEPKVRPKPKAVRRRRTGQEIKLREAAHRFVAVAVRCGFLSKLDGSQPCVDCGHPATCYEHRDYARPLDVEPVCRSCNATRGMGAMPAQIAANDS